MKKAMRSIKKLKRGIRDFGRMEDHMAKDHVIIRIKVTTMDIGMMVNHIQKMMKEVPRDGKMDLNILVNGLMGKLMDKERN
jgi:hypothetical protein